MLYYNNDFILGYFFEHTIVLPLLLGHTLLKWKKSLIGGVASLEGDNLVVSYYLGAYEIWPVMKGGL
jgi:hypothetical protein